MQVACLVKNKLFRDWLMEKGLSSIRISHARNVEGTYKEDGFSPVKPSNLGSLENRSRFCGRQPSHQC